ncbi:MAG: MarR family winged helix-turn-helix transcriptional regulator [Jatrophihabitans sp.]
MSEQIEAVLDASRVLVAVSSQSLSAVDEGVTLTQFRVLVILASRGPLDLNALADHMGVHPSNATRACDKLVALQLVERNEDPADRRRLLLAPSAAGTRLLRSVSAQRRKAIRGVVAKMRPQSRRHLGQVMRDFATAGGELPTDQWAGVLLGPP